MTVPEQHSADVIGGPGVGDGNLIEDGVGDIAGILVYIPYLDVVVQGNTVNNVVTGLVAIGGATGGSATFIDNTVSRTSPDALTLRLGYERRFAATFLRRLRYGGHIQRKQDLQLSDGNDRRGAR